MDKIEYFNLDSEDKEGILYTEKRSESNSSHKYFMDK